jgi:hypothetical protein
VFRRLLRPLAVAALAAAPVLTAPGYLAPASGVGATYRLYNYDPPGATPPVYSRWNPCAPVPWKANVTQAGSSPVARRAALQDVAGALARISQATGVRFRYEVPRVPWRLDTSGSGAGPVAG